MMVSIATRVVLSPRAKAHSYCIRLKVSPTARDDAWDALAWELVKTFLEARFSGVERHRCRLDKVAELESQEKS